MDKAKRDLIQLWLTKAEHDLIAAKALAKSEDRILDVAIYHCQQAAEKAVKALLIAHDIRFEKIHDIKILITSALPVAPGFSELIERAERLTDYATEFRYPGQILEPDLDEFKQALEDAELFFQTAQDMIKKAGQDFAL